MQPIAPTNRKPGALWRTDCAAIPRKCKASDCFVKSSVTWDKSCVRVLDNSLADLLAAAPICQQTGLLINDALIVALMQANRLTKLASHDADFDRVPGITRYAPV